MIDDLAAAIFTLIVIAFIQMIGAHLIWKSPWA
jgi:hypothetical protein